MMESIQRRNSGGTSVDDGIRDPHLLPPFFAEDPRPLEEVPLLAVDLGFDDPAFFVVDAFLEPVDIEDAFIDPEDAGLVFDADAFSPAVFLGGYLPSSLPFSTDVFAFLPFLLY